MIKTTKTKRSRFYFFKKIYVLESYFIRFGFQPFRLHLKIEINAVQEAAQIT
jgi:hypothetical protein